MGATRYTHHRAATAGFIMPILLFTIMFIMMLIAVSGSFAVTSYNLSTRDVYRVDAQLAADAGLDDAISKVNTINDWTGSGGEVELMNTNNVRTTYQTTVTTAADNTTKTVAVTARTYSPAASTTAKITRKYEVDLRAVTSGFNVASVVSGVGGLVMNNNSKITGGDVVVNGTISMSNQSQIGTQTNAVNIRVAHQSCPIPANATYPQVCGSGNGQPITMTNNAKIYGDVQANNQTSGTNMTNPGLTANSGVTPTTLPAYDRSTFTVATTKNATDSGIKCSNNGSLTWPANVKIIGNVNMGNNCTITLSGNVWITGNLTTGNQGKIIVPNSLGTNRPVIMVDGSSGFTLSNNGVITPNNVGTGVELRTFWSNAGCSPGCSSVTGTDLANSQNVRTIDLGNNGNAANSVFIAQWSRVRISNNGALGAVAGQSIEMGNQAVINFTASVPGSSNLTQTWVKRGYMRVFN